MLDYTSLRNDQKECARKLITEIQEHLIRESKDEMNKLLNHLVDTVEKLKQNSNTLDMLKENRARHSEIRLQKPFLKAKIPPIKKKFEYIKSWEGEAEGGDIEGCTEDDMRKVEGLEDAWKYFEIGMDEASRII